MCTMSRKTPMYLSRHDIFNLGTKYCKFVQQYSLKPWLHTEDLYINSNILLLALIRLDWIKTHPWQMDLCCLEGPINTVIAEYKMWFIVPRISAINVSRLQQSWRISTDCRYKIWRVGHLDGTQLQLLNIYQLRTNHELY